MNTEQALKALKIYTGVRVAKPDIYDDLTITQALTIAIECMEARKAEIVNAFDYGYASGYDDAQGDGATYEDGVQYYNSLTRPQSDTEMYLDSCDKCYAMTNHRDGICLKCEHLTNPNTPIR